MSLSEQTASPPVWHVERDGSVRLYASQQTGTDKVYFPPLPEQSPLRDGFKTILLSPTGSLYSYTIIHPSPKTGRPSFVLAMVDFPEKVRVLGKLIVDDSKQLAIGMPVCVALSEAVGDSRRYIFQGMSNHG